MARISRRPSGASRPAGALRTSRSRRGSSGGVSDRTAGRMGARKRNAGAGAMGSIALGAIMLVAGIGLTMSSGKTDARGNQSGGTIYIGLIAVGAITCLSGVIGAARSRG